MEKIISKSPVCSASNVSVAILAGGQASRLGGLDKGLLSLAGKPLLEYVLPVAEKAKAMYLIANRNQQAYAHYGVSVYGDLETGYQGPLMGIATALHHSTTEWTVVLPCDAPKMPLDMVDQLIAEQQRSAADIVMVEDEGGYFPVAALIKTALYDDLLKALSEGVRKIVRWYFMHSVATVKIPSEQLGNINTPAEKAAFEAATVINKAKQINAPFNLAGIPLLGISAYSGTGKTTLLTSILPALKADGLRIAVIKHAHHSFDVDKPGKDSYQIREAGAEQVVLSSNKRIAIMIDHPQPQDCSLHEVLQKMPLEGVDLVLVEGFKHQTFAKLELYRSVLGKPLLCCDDDSVIALATEQDIADLPDDLITLDLNNHDAISAFVRAYVKHYVER